MNNRKWNEINFSLTDLAIASGLRFVSGFGLGLLLAGSINERIRKRLGWSLFLGSIGVGVPLGIQMLRRDRETGAFISTEPDGHEQPAANQVPF